ncbi:hypothetical protein GDO86_007089 [Hymenochirus boettgeri]|uniref:THO complex subunit 7 homolog n=1 Tax=Hymenochirus boettgeri TaxID=247094 RepID=A0A8T2IXP5_9PIPI|nr:hypothetical protein GDO86_007089 [Hymenochirus boettgeri]
MGAVTDDEVIRKRLLIDGDGAGDDRRINLMVKSFLKWCNSGVQEDGQYQRMLSTLSQCEFSMGKTLQVHDMNLREMENMRPYITREIAECKKQILQAKRIRKTGKNDIKHKSPLFYFFPEYDALAKVIQLHPDRHETLKQLEALDKELKQFSHTKEKVEDKKKQFHVLLSTIHELQHTLENDDKLAEESQDSQMDCDNP